MMNRAALGLGVLAAVTLAGPSSAQVVIAPPAIAQPGMNLGDTSFLDGGGGPGWTLELLGSASTARDSNDANGHRLPGNHGLDAGVFNIHPLYTSSLKVLGGYLGFDVIVPLAVVGADVPGGRYTTRDVGDIAVGTSLQWSGLHLAGRPFDMRAAISVTLPTGAYSRNQPVNIGNNVWQVTPYIAATWQPTDTWEISARVTYNWSGVNDAPNTGSTIATAQAGDQIGVNLASSYAIRPQIRVGMSGFAYQQLSDTRSDGLAIPGSRQRLFGIGPGLVWNASSSSIVLANVYREFGAENRSEGYSVRLRLLQSF